MGRGEEEIVRVELSDSWNTSLKFDELRKKIREFFNEFKIKIRKSTDTQIIGRQGSQLKTRTGGGIWIDPALFPKKLFINIKLGESGRNQIDVRFEESMGLYLLTSGMKQKYQDYFERLMETLKERIPEFELNTISSSTDILSEGFKFCAYCGAQTVKDDQKYCVNCGKEIL